MAESFLQVMYYLSVFIFVQNFFLKNIGKILDF